MFSWILQISIISIIFIFLVHHLLCFFKTTLTIPKIKDLVNSPVKKYQDIFDTIAQGSSSIKLTSVFAQGSTNNNNYLPANNERDDYTDINLLPTENTNSGSNDMKDELKSFLKKQFNSSNELDHGPSFGSAF
jgi:hypothetical protein